MHWNPFQYQYNATYLSDEGEMALLEVRKGTDVERVPFPKIMLPPSLTLGASFNIKLEDTETARTSEAQTLRRLLNDLIQ